MIEQFIDWILNNPMDAILAFLGVIGINIPMIITLFQNIKQSISLKKAYQMIDEYKEKLDLAKSEVETKVLDYMKKIDEKKQEGLTLVDETVKGFQSEFNQATHEMKQFYEVLSHKIDLLESEKNKHVYQVRQD